MLICCSSESVRSTFVSPAPDQEPACHTHSHPSRPSPQCLFPLDAADVSVYVLSTGDPHYVEAHSRWGAAAPHLAEVASLSEEAAAVAFSAQSPLRERSPGRGNEWLRGGAPPPPDLSPPFAASAVDGLEAGDSPPVPHLDASPALFPAAIPVRHASSDSGSGCATPMPSWALGSPASFPAAAPPRHDSSRSSSPGSSFYGSPLFPLPSPAVGVAMPLSLLVSRADEHRHSPQPTQLPSHPTDAIRVPGRSDSSHGAGSISDSVGVGGGSPAQEECFTDGGACPTASLGTRLWAGAGAGVGGGMGGGGAPLCGSGGRARAKSPLLELMRTGTSQRGEAGS